MNAENALKPLDWIREHSHSGLCFLPAIRKEKRPAGPWKRFAARMPSDAELLTFSPSADAVCVVTGRVSGGAKGVGLIALDFDQRAKAFEAWRASVDPALFDRLVMETTQNGGRHLFWRSARATVGNEKFAMDANGVLIESRCEGGLCICSPTAGYEMLQCDFARVPTLTPEEHDALIAAARALDERPAKVETPRTEVRTAEGGRPGDDFNARGQDEFRQVLERHGWTYLGQSGENESWRRPGKTEGGLSASWNQRTFYVFSTNAQPFEGGVGYSAFHVFSLLEHGGDFSAAARALAAKGYGDAPRCTVVGSPTDEEIADVRREQVRDPGLLPERLCAAEGMIGELAGFTLATAPRPNVRLAFAGALTSIAHVAGLARFADGYDTRPNLYLMALANSGVGKNAPRKATKLFAAAIGEGASVIDAVGSGQGLEDAFIGQRAILCNLDEVHKFAAALRDKESALAQNLMATLLQIYSESDELHVFRRLAQTRVSERSRRPAFVIEPHLSLFATGIPAMLFQALSMEAMTDGFAARCILIEAGPRGPAGTPHRAELPPRVVEQARRLCELGGIVDASGGPYSPAPPNVIGESEAARRLRAEYVEESDRLYAACPESEQGAADRALYARLLEKTSKVALVLAVSASPENPIIEPRHLEQAWAIVSHGTERMRYLAHRYLFESEFDALAKRALRFVGEYGKPMPRSALLRALHIDARTFDNLVTTLGESHQLVSVPGTRAGAVCYKAV